MSRKKRFSYYSLNIKRSNSKNDNKTQAYKELFLNLHESKISINVWSDKMLYVRRLHDYGDFIHGKISKFTDLSGEWLDFETGEVAKVSIPPNVFPNWKDIDFYFFPSEHKLAVHKNSLISLNLVVKFLRGAFEFLYKDELITVDVIQSEDIFKKIYESKEIRRLEISVTYTNDDLLKEYGEFFDEEMKSSSIGELDLIAKPDSSKTINLNNKVIGGAMELAKSNGSVKASVINTEGRREQIMTYKHPSINTVDADEDEPTSIGQVIWDRFIQLFRSNDA